VILWTALEGEGGRSMRKWREILRPGCVARLKLVIIASVASSIVRKMRIIHMGDTY
jgi:ABC-type enterobactin transport system permease subunit